MSERRPSGRAAVCAGNEKQRNAREDERGAPVSLGAMHEVEEENDQASYADDKGGGIEPGIDENEEGRAREQGALSMAVTAGTLAGLFGYALKAAVVEGDVVAQLQFAAALGGYAVLFCTAWWFEARRRRRADGRIWALAECRLAIVLVPLFGCVWGIEGASTMLGTALAGAVWLAGMVDGVCIRRLAGGQHSAIPGACTRIWGCWGDWINGSGGRPLASRALGASADLARIDRADAARRTSFGERPGEGLRRR